MVELGVLVLQVLAIIRLRSDCRCERQQCRGVRSANHSFSLSFTYAPKADSLARSRTRPHPALEHLRKRQMPVKELVLPHEPLDLPPLRRRQRVGVGFQPPQHIGG